MTKYSKPVFDILLRLFISFECLFVVVCISLSIFVVEMLRIPNIPKHLRILHRMSHTHKHLIKSLSIENLIFNRNGIVIELKSCSHFKAICCKRIILR